MRKRTTRFKAGVTFVDDSNPSQLTIVRWIDDQQTCATVELNDDIVAMIAHSLRRYINDQDRRVKRMREEMSGANS